MRVGSKLKTKEHGFEGRNIRESNWYDDSILDHSHMRHVMKGRRRECRLQEFGRGRGDSETFFRAVAVLERLWEKDEKEALADSVVKCANMCLSLTFGGGLDEALMDNFGAFTLVGVDIPGLAAWGSVCWVRGADVRDCTALLNRAHEEGARMCLVRMFDNFDMLTFERYTMEGFVRTLNQQE